MKNRSHYFYYEDIPSDVKQKMIGNSYIDNDDIKLDDLVLVHVLHIGSDYMTHRGELIVNKKIADDIVDIFKNLYLNNYLIEKIKLIDDYGADDSLSMMDNNTSAFNYRYIMGTNKLSNHSYGLAVDINPLYNPYVYDDGTNLVISPKESIDYVDRTKEFTYKIDKDDLCYKEFIKHGFSWGGDWTNKKDYQHFEKIE